MAVSKRKRSIGPGRPMSPYPQAPSAGADAESSVGEAELPSSKRARRGHTREEIDALKQGKAYQDAIDILEHLLADECAYMFSKPVLELWTEEEVPGYAEAVPYPMDLGTLMKKVKQLELIVEREGKLEFDDATFVDDLRRIFKNCMSYNDAKSEYYRHARRLLVRTDRRYTQRQQARLTAREVAVNGDARGAATSAPSDTPRASTARVSRPRPAKSETPDTREELPVSHSDEGFKPSPQVTPRSGLQASPKKAAKVQSSASVVPYSTVARTTEQVAGSSVSSEDAEGLEHGGDPSFIFVSTEGMEKKRGRKSGLVQELENKHESLTKRRKLLLDSAVKLEQLKKDPMSMEEKAALCEEVAVLDFVRMKTVVDIIARGMNRQDILQETEVDMDIESIDNSVLREVQAFIGSATVVAAHGTLENVDREIANVEMELVSNRFQRIA